MEEGSQNRCLEARAQLADDENVFSAVDRGIRKVNLKGFVVDVVCTCMRCM